MRSLPSVVLAAAVAVLVVGAVLLGSEGSDFAARAETIVADLYEDGDAEALVARLAEGSYPAEQREQLEQGLAQVLAAGGEVQPAGTYEIQGTRVARTVVTGSPDLPELEWCVLPDGTLLLACRLGTAEFQPRTDVTGINVQRAAATVYPERVDLSVVLTPAGEETVPLDGLELAAPDADGAFALTDATYFAGGGRLPALGQQLNVRPGVGLLLTFTTEEPTDHATAAGGPFTLRWDGGAIELPTAEVTWFLPEDPEPA